MSRNTTEDFPTLNVKSPPITKYQCYSCKLNCKLSLFAFEGDPEAYWNID